MQPRSGLALRHGVTVLNSPGLIDAGYRDELRVLLVNLDPVTRLRGPTGRPHRPAGDPAGSKQASSPGGHPVGVRPWRRWLRPQRALAMPELPEVEALARFLAERTKGATIVRVELATLSALKTFDPPLDALVGRSLRGLAAAGKVPRRAISASCGWRPHLARGGWVQWREQLAAGAAQAGQGAAGPAGRARQRVRLRRHRAGHREAAGHLGRAGLDDVDGSPGSVPIRSAPDFDRAALVRPWLRRTGNVKTVLTDQSVLAGVGNAYSDEALHLAKMSPFKIGGQAERRRGRAALSGARRSARRRGRHARRDCRPPA